MTKNLLLELFADSVQINDVDFVQCRHLVYSSTEFGESLRGKRGGRRDSDINVSVGVSRTFGPGTEPDDLNVSAQHASSKIRDLFRDLSRSSEKRLRNHSPVYRFWP
ncbi:MAG: hypothetical protein AAB308_10510 [Nitrospirota bacterium]